MSQQTQRITNGSTSTSAASTDYSWMVPIEVMLGSIDHKEVQACSICSIPHRIRRPKPECYTPTLVSIGPLHRGGTQLQVMEEPKWRYTLSLLRRDGSSPDETRKAEVRLRDCGTTALGLANVVQATYGGNLDLDDYELAKIMLVDGCFVLELLLRIQRFREAQNNNAANNNIHSDDPILGNEEKLVSALNDLTLLENQVPFIVLKKLYRKIFPAANIKIEDDHRVSDIALNALGYPLVHKPGVAHLLHLTHLSILNHHDQHNNQLVKQARQELNYCATRLRASGIIIRPSTPSTNVVTNKFTDSFDFNISFNDKALEIPQLFVKETTEVKWRNMIAWEQSRIGIRCKFTSYALFFQGLICCEHDVELLEESQVIVNETKKSKEELVRMFRTMTVGVDYMDSSYSEVCERLNKCEGAKALMKNWVLIVWHQWRRSLDVIVYYWQNWYNILVRDHIPTVWKLIGVLAAALLLALTVMQTYYAANSNNK